MNVAFLSLGGNMFDRAEHLKTAKTLIELGCGPILKTSSLYETESWGIVSKNKYLNQVIQIQTRLNPMQLLKTILNIEKKMGRKREGPRYSDRIIDIDLLFYNDLILSNEHLTLPHPHIAIRKFVLLPLHEIAPGLRHPVLKKQIKQLLQQCNDELKVELYKAPQQLRYICIEGNIGSGKSSLAKQLAKELKAIYLPEEFQKMQLLPLFYNDPKLYAFSLEFSFLISRFEQITACFEQSQQLIVSDFSIYKSVWFAKVNLKKEEFALFKKQFETICFKLPEPDLIIHLQSNTNNLLNNIRKRGRTFEQGIRANYLEALFKAYSKGFSQLDHIKQLPLFVKKYHARLEKEHIQVVAKFLKENFAQTL